MDKEKLLRIEKRRREMEQAREEDRKALRNEVEKERRDKICSDPVRCAAFKKAKLKYYWELKNDPVKYKMHLAYQRLSMKRYRAKVKADPVRNEEYKRKQRGYNKKKRGEKK